jgi:hypothetical protein
MRMSEEHVVRLDVSGLLGQVRVGSAGCQGVPIEVIARGRVHGEQRLPAHREGGGGGQAPEECDLVSRELLSVSSAGRLGQWLARRGHRHSTWWASAWSWFPRTASVACCRMYSTTSRACGPYETRSPTTSKWSWGSAASTASSAGQLACRSEITNIRIAGSSLLRAVRRPSRDSAAASRRPWPARKQKLPPPATTVGVISPLEAGGSGANSIARRLHVYPSGRGVSSAARVTWCDPREAARRSIVLYADIASSPCADNRSGSRSGSRLPTS